jgi:ribosomal protein S18 acetylase RimI-like enzyme
MATNGTMKAPEQNKMEDALAQNMNPIEAPAQNNMSTGSAIYLRAMQPADAPMVASLWRQGLSQSTMSQTNPCCMCLMCVLIKKMELQAISPWGDVGPEGKNLAIKWGGAEYPTEDASRDCKIMLVAVDKSQNDLIVGCCGVKRGTDENKDFADAGTTDVFSIWRLSVSEKARGGGLGRRLMKACEEWAREHGGKKMVLYTGNPAASKFYVKIGYTKSSAFAHEKDFAEAENKA